MTLRNIAPRLTRLAPVKLAPRPKVAEGFYSTPEWKALRAQLIRQRGAACEGTEHSPAASRTGHRLFADHVIELRDGGAPLDPTNVQLLCGACHTRKTAAARAARYATRPPRD